jgi:pyruvate ferredoxin oxidoreductase delta subunit
MAKLTFALISKPASSRANKTGSWRVYKPRWKHDKCVGCRLCDIVCPEGCVSGTGKKKESTMNADFIYCKGCGICAKECPVKDIEMIMEVK